MMGSSKPAGRPSAGAVDEDTVEVTLQFEKPVSAEDLRERFQELADAMADVEDEDGDDR